MLSEVFGEQVKKSNFESVLERHINQNITTLVNKNNQKFIGISYINNCPTPSTPTPDQSQPKTPDQEESKNQTKIETIDKLRQFGLSDEPIAEALDIPLELVKQVDLKD